ncbi:MAG: hypothetical protein KF835_14475 [Xanthobacteraceae bacterium]|nr:hypothetical protein [Xanthobacteraceae bacterium]
MQYHVTANLRDLIDTTIKAIRRKRKKERASDRFIEEFVITDLKARNMIVEAELNGGLVLEMREITEQDVAKAKRYCEERELHENDHFDIDGHVRAWVCFAAELYSVEHPDEEASDSYVSHLMLNQMKVSGELEFNLDATGAIAVRFTDNFPNDAAVGRLQTLVAGFRRRELQ